MIAVAAASVALLFSALANGGFAGAEGVRPGHRVQIDLGLLEAGVPQDVVVPIISQLDYDWAMPSVDVSCPACIEVHASPRVLRAREVAEVVLQVIPTGTPGPHRWGVSLHGGGEPPLRIDVTGVIAGLSVRPNLAAFGICPLGTSPEIGVAVVWHGEGRLERVQVASNNDTVSAIVHTPSSEGDAEFRLTLDGGVRRARYLGGTVQVDATIRKPDGSPHVVRADLPISGRVVDPAIQLRPASVFLGSIGIDESAEVTVQVLAIPKGEMSLRSDMPGLHAHRSGSGSGIHVRYEPPPGTCGVQRGAIRLDVGDPPLERAQIPIMVYVRREPSE
jgi:hypothetical protein